MAKISRMLLNEAKDGLTDEVFFTSKTMISHFESIIEGVCKTYHRRINVVVTSDPGEWVANTSGEVIRVNMNCSWIKAAKTRVEKYYLIVGIILHECAHVLYTDFKLMKKSQSALNDNRLFPKIPLSEALEDFFDKNQGRRFQRIYHTLDNCIEDGHIEKRILRSVPGYGECLMKVRQLHIGDSLKETYGDVKKNCKESGMKLDRIAAFLNLTLVYAKYGIENTGEVVDDLTMSFDEMKGHINKAVSTNNSALRKMEVNVVFDKLIEFISEELKTTDLESDEPEADETKDESSAPSEAESEETSEEGSAGSFEDDMTSEGENTGSDDPDEGESEGIKGEMSEEEISEKLDDIMSKLDEMCDGMEDMSDHTYADTTPTDEAETEADSVDEVTGEEGQETERRGTDGPADWDLSYLEDEAAKEEAAKIVKKGIVKTLSKIGDDTRKGRIDKYPSIEQYVDPDGIAESMYEAEHEELDRIARRVVKNLDKVIKERQKGDKLTGLYSGKRLDAAHAYRRDKRIFSNKILPEDIPDMEVCVLVDCSGSMSYGTRMEQSRKCAYITWKFCQQMEIPCSVYGHTTDWAPERHVKMTCVAHPGNIDKDDGKRIFMLRPEANNRDGWAVNFCCEALIKSKAESKLLLIISDGVPAADNYGTVLGKKDCQEVIRKYKKKGISVITAGIDDCAAEIKNVYLDGVSPKEAAKFLDYSDMSQLPRAFATLIKKELL